MNVRRISRLAMVFAALLVLVAACGDDDHTATTGGSTAAGAPGSNETGHATDTAHGGESGAKGESGAGAAVCENTGAAPADAVNIEGFKFLPDKLSVKIDAPIRFTNSDAIGHTFTLDDDSIDSGTIAEGCFYETSFSKAGTYSYHCHIHPSMKATIEVA